MDIKTENKKKLDIIVYTDGSCIGNELQDISKRRAGLGVYFPGNRDFNISKPLPIPPMTNNRAEMYAVIDCLLTIMNNREYFDDYYTRKVIIHTDSKFTIDLLTKWLANWKKNGYKTAKKKPVKNKDLVVMLDNTVQQAKSQGYIVEFKHVRAHKAEPKCEHHEPEWIQWFCNDRADKLAVRGSNQLL